MATRLRCPQCRTRLEIPGDVPVGKSVRCPQCQTVFVRAAEPDEEDFDEEYDERPRRKGKRKKKSGTPIWLQIVGAVICLTIIGVCIAIVVAKRDPDNAQIKVENR